MTGTLLHINAIVFCEHTGQAMPVMAVPQVMVSGNPVVTQMDSYTVTGCQNPTLTNGAPACATAQWSTAATKVFANKIPVLLSTSQATCIPTGTGLIVVNTQTFVKGQ